VDIGPEGKQCHLNAEIAQAVFQKALPESAIYKVYLPHRQQTIYHGNGPELFLLCLGVFYCFLTLLN
jgi:hypothetical protein